MTDPEFFKETESTLDTIISGWYDEVRKSNNPKLKAAYEKLGEALSEFQNAATEAGYKGHWCA